MDSEPTGFNSVEEAIATVAAGGLVVVTDNEQRENEGDLVMAASKATPETINQMIRFGSGIVCVPMTGPHLGRLGLRPMVAQNRESFRTDYTVSVDAAEGITTGISAYDRSQTIRLLSSPDTSPEALVQPGHVFPIRARPGGVLERAGHTEAAVDLASLAGLHPSGVICEVTNEDGTMARLPELQAFCKEYGYPLIRIADLIEYRFHRDRLVEPGPVESLETKFGTFDLRVFRGRIDQRRHLVLSQGSLDEAPILVRVHGEDRIGDLFAVQERRGDLLIQKALEQIAQEGRGVLVYIERPGGGIEESTTDGRPEPVQKAPKMDLRDYGTGAQILASLGLKQIRLLSTRRPTVVGLEGYGLEIVEVVDFGSEG